MATGNTGVVILNWNAQADTLRTLSQITDAKFVAIVIDNDSKVDPTKEIITKYPATKVIRNDSNRGFAPASNQGIKWAIEKDCEFVLLLNNDVEISQTSLSALVQTLKNNPDCAAVTPAIYYDSNFSRLWYAGNELHLNRANVPHLKTLVSVTPYASPTLNGAVLLLRTSALKQVGLLDEDYFAYFEDVDLTLRFARAGYLLLVEPRVKCVHHVSNSVGEGSPRQYYYFYRNRLKFCKKHGTRLQFIAGQLSVLGDLCVLATQATRSMIKLKIHPDRFKILRAAWRGTNDFYRNYHGEIPT